MKKYLTLIEAGQVWFVCTCIKSVPLDDEVCLVQGRKYKVAKAGKGFVKISGVFKGYSFVNQNDINDTISVCSSNLNKYLAYETI